MKGKTEKFYQKLVRNRGLLGFLFLLFHFSMIFLYVSPAGFTNNTLRKYSSYYTTPIFNQQWSLFAPAPVDEHHIFIKTSKNEDWIDIMKSDYKKAEQYYITNHWRWAVASYNLLYWVRRDLDYYQNKHKHIPDCITEKEWKGYFSGAMLKSFAKAQMKRIKYEPESDTLYIKTVIIPPENKNVKKLEFLFTE